MTMHHAESIVAWTVLPMMKPYLSVKSARSHESAIQDVSSVGGCNDNDAGVALKAVHLCQQLVEGLFSLIIASTNASASRSADSINLIYKDNAWCILLGLQANIWMSNNISVPIAHIVTGDSGPIVC